MTVLNIASYQFQHIPQNLLQALRQQLKEKAIGLGLKGTILLGLEGINLNLAGEVETVHQYQEFLENETPFKNLTYRSSTSEETPFTRMLVKLKKEVITLGQEQINPAERTGEYITPAELKRFYDEQQDMVIVDTRNDYETVIGTFKNAIDLNISTFKEFPEAAEKKLAEYKNKKIITYCTGGIRCEKATAVLLKLGFEKVYQLQGGILNYFAECGGEHYEGECFVFDDRISVDTQLCETGTILCEHCQMPITQQQQKTVLNCPYCQNE